MIDLDYSLSFVEDSGNFPNLLIGLFGHSWGAYCDYRTDLFNTLVKFFNNNLSYKKTSDILYIHVNTLRARIKTIEKILDLDIMSVDAIVNIRIMLILKLHNFF
ncbi:helix-turn-helix domain-containing protein [Eremococcus coleocola]|uniref:helix-turn-helix domain-containing protein n=1 Tax=Eremococcus coleocola TaxID=88132 RepID=UPI0004831347|nr:helix-turn-helix domain-containing protein [Eremococcus coleocola]